ncbi:MAG: beta-N-acetylhexosaminidase [Deltaproteobacteria bacterium]|nr:beta-N-acetylhexosaminidase [Deltaproteobacteria bacterium]
MLPIGQLFMTGFDGITPPPELLSLIREEQLGGVILFARNIRSLPQLIELTAQLREAAGRTLLIAIDHEGGRVVRLKPPFTKPPPMAWVGAYADAHPAEPVAHALGEMMGRELAAAGINVNFAPVLDINTNPDNPIIGDRALHQSPRRVAELGCDLLRGLHAGGVMSCGKHFPGHGDTPEDSHLTLPNMPATWDRLRQFELLPFRAAIAAGCPMLMTAHILYGVIDSVSPVTLSKWAITTLLRKEMGYDGVVVTDDLEMGAIARQMPPDVAAVRALAAGCDLCLICRDIACTRRAIARVREALAARELLAEPIAAAIARVHRLMDRAAHLPPPPPYTIIGDAAHRALVTRITAHAGAAKKQHVE